MEPSLDLNDLLPAPPPPPPQRSRRSLWVGLGIGAAVLLLCVLVLGVASILFWPQITNFLYTQGAVRYSNPDAGITLYYPKGWQVQEGGAASSGYTIDFGSSTDVLNNPSSTSSAGGLLAIWTGLTSDQVGVSFQVEASTMDQLVDSLAASLFTDPGSVINLQRTTIGGFPSASGEYLVSFSSTEQIKVYLIAVLRQPDIIVILGLCPPAEWARYQPTFDKMLKSMTITLP